jgi:hypothetical protein
MITTRTTRLSLRIVPLLAVALLACAAVLTTSGVASAQRVYVYGPPPPPPPPPPPGYYAYPPPRYYAPREPPYAFVLAGELEGAVPVNVPQFADHNQLQGGGGFKVRVGEQFNLPGWVHVTPELGYGFDHLFASDDFGTAFSWDLHRVFAGGRLSFGRVVEPVIYAHAGLGWRVESDPTVPQASGLAADVGGAIDLHLVPHLVLGVHAEYATINVQPSQPEWVALGVHAQLLF